MQRLMGSAGSLNEALDLFEEITFHPCFGNRTHVAQVKGQITCEVKRVLRLSP